MPHDLHAADLFLPTLDSTGGRKTLDDMQLEEETCFNFLATSDAFLRRGFIWALCSLRSSSRAPLANCLHTLCTHACPILCRLVLQHNQSHYSSSSCNHFLNVCDHVLLILGRLSSSNLWPSTWTEADHLFLWAIVHGFVLHGAQAEWCIHTL